MNWAGVLLPLLLFFTCFPATLFHKPYSTILLDNEEKLIGGRIATDGQWRFPQSGQDVTENFEKAINAFEDKRFYFHPGVDPLAMIRACRDLIATGSFQSGGSTITMQIMRLARGNQKRTIGQKLAEILWSLHAEMRYSKKELLQLYAAHAPFGGNIVGLEAASWRYFNKDADQLSIGEAASLAVLPNAPGLVHPGKNRDVLLTKRNVLLKRMVELKMITEGEYQLSLSEPIPDVPLPLPDHAPHLLSSFHESGEIIKSTLDADKQIQMSQLLQRHVDVLSMNGVYNAALLVMETETGNVLAYVGNSTDMNEIHNPKVDMIRAERSSGSILKPFLYCASLQNGQLTPKSLVFDVPTSIRGYQPQNFSRQFMGMVAADQALAMSLNVPAVRLLREYGILPFKEKLEAAGITTLRFSPDHYGLTLVLGGAEVTLWDVCGAYASMGRSLSHAHRDQFSYDVNDIHPPVVISNKKEANRKIEMEGVWQHGAIWQTFEAMTALRRPDEEGQWETFHSGQKIAWKTGTSFGFRDAWAVGITPSYTIGVWIGNADGEGRPGVIGLYAAAPLMFEAFRLLPQQSEWWDTPYEAMTPKVTCRESGWIAGSLCNQTDTTFIVKSNHVPSVCQFHQSVATDFNHTFRHSPVCAEVSGESVSWFTIPVEAETFYKRFHPEYKSVPDWHQACAGDHQQNSLAVLYPRPGTKIYVPKTITSERSKAVFTAVHTSDTASVYWHLDEKFVAKTKEHHQIALSPSPGKHVLVVQDENGGLIETPFEVLPEKEN